MTTPRRKIPDDAFEVYVGLGAKRSYQAVADHFGVSKKAVTNRAVKERWQERLARVEVAAQERADAAITEDYAGATERHLRICRAIQHRALQGLQNMPLRTAMECVRALDLSIKAEQAMLRPAKGEAVDPNVRIEVVTGIPPELGEPSGGGAAGESLGADDESDRPLNWRSEEGRSSWRSQ